MEQGGGLMMRQISKEDDGCEINIKVENVVEEESGKETVFLNVNSVEPEGMSEKYIGWSQVRDPLAQDAAAPLCVLKSIVPTAALLKFPKKYVPNILKRRKSAETPNLLLPPIVKQHQLLQDPSSSLQRQIVIPNTPTLTPIRMQFMNPAAETRILQPTMPPSSGIRRNVSKVQPIAPKPGPIIIDSCSLAKRPILLTSTSCKTPPQAKQVRYDRGPDKDGMYSCTYCNGKFKTCGRARNHEARAHIHAPEKRENSNTKPLKQSKDESYDCRQCGLEFVSDSELRLHVETVHSKLFCGVCHRKFTSQSYLEFHMSMHQPSDSLTRFQCPECGHRCRNNKSLQNHISKHKRQELRCDFCAKIYTDKTSLKLHMKKHLGILPHKCNTCGLGFVASYTLRRHMRTHTGERPYECRICGDRFNCCGSRYWHMSIHGNVSVYACAVCGEGTKSKRAALNHCNGSSFDHL